MAVPRFADAPLSLAAAHQANAEKKGYGLISFLRFESIRTLPTAGPSDCKSFYVIAEECTSRIFLEQVASSTVRTAVDC